MILIPQQFFGLGDIIFTQTLVRNLMAPGDKVLWYVEPQFVEGLRAAYPDFTFMDKKHTSVDLNSFNDNWQEARNISYRVMPLRFADSILKVPYYMCMMAKYLLYNMDYTEWKDKAMWKRNPLNELRLYKELELEANEKYNLINTFFASDSQYQVPITCDNGFRNIQMRTIEGYSLFDWATVIERATNIHTVSTSIIYLLELLHPRAEEIHLYPRKPQEMNFENIKYILTKDYILHE